MIHGSATVGIVETHVHWHIGVGREALVGNTIPDCIWLELFWRACTGLSEG